MRDESTRRDRSKDLKILEECLSKADERALEQTCDQVFQETSKRNFDAWLAAKPVPYWGTEREEVMTADPNLFCPECGVYFTKHFVESPTCCFTLLDEVLNGVHEFGWMPKDQSPRGVASRGSKETPAFALYLQ